MEGGGFELPLLHLMTVGRGLDNSRLDREEGEC